MNHKMVWAFKNSTLGKVYQNDFLLSIFLICVGCAMFSDLMVMLIIGFLWMGYINDFELMVSQIN